MPRDGRLKITIHPSTLNTGDPATHYRIEYREKGESGWRTFRVVEAPAPTPPSMMPASVSMTVTPTEPLMVEHIGLSDGVTYEYQVFSLVTKGSTFEESSWAASCVGTTPGAQVVDVRTQQPAFIAAPECVGAVYERSEDAINLTWSHMSDQGIPATVFRIEVAQGATGLLSYFSLAQLMSSGEVGHLVVRNLESEQFYTFRIFALGNHPTAGLVESPPSSNFDRVGNPVCSFVWLPEAGFPKPQNFRVVEQGGDAITLRWNPPPDVTNIFGYQLEHRPEGQTDWDRVADFESTQKYHHPITRPATCGPNRGRRTAVTWPSSGTRR